MSVSLKEFSPFGEVARDSLLIRPHVPAELLDAFDRMAAAALSRALDGSALSHEPAGHETPANGMASTPFADPTLTLIEGGRDAS